MLSDAEIVAPDEAPKVSRDPKDDKFIACAVTADAHYIVSEDKDLLVIEKHESVEIINALQFHELLK